MILLANEIQISCDTCEGLQKNKWYDVLFIESYRDLDNNEISIYAVVSGKYKKAVLVDLANCKIRKKGGNK